MISKTETELNVDIVESPLGVDNPMQERHCGKVAESAEVTAEDILNERKHEVREKIGTGFRPVDRQFL